MWPYKKNNTVLYYRLYLKGVQLGGSFKNIQIKSIIQYNVYNCIKSDCDFKQTIKRFLTIFLPNHKMLHLPKWSSQTV